MEAGFLPHHQASTPAALAASGSVCMRVGSAVLFPSLRAPPLSLSCLIGCLCLWAGEGFIAFGALASGQHLALTSRPKAKGSLSGGCVRGGTGSREKAGAPHLPAWRSPSYLPLGKGGKATDLSFLSSAADRQFLMVSSSCSSHLSEPH